MKQAFQPDWVSNGLGFRNRTDKFVTKKETKIRGPGARAPAVNVKIIFQHLSMSAIKCVRSHVLDYLCEAASVVMQIRRLDQPESCAHDELQIHV